MSVSINANVELVGRKLIRANGDEVKIVKAMARGYKVEGDRAQIKACHVIMANRKLTEVVVDIDEADVRASDKGYIQLRTGTLDNYMPTQKSTKKDPKPSTTKPSTTTKTPKVKKGRKELYERLLAYSAKKPTTFREVYARMVEFFELEEVDATGHKPKSKKLRELRVLALINDEMFDEDNVLYIVDAITENNADVLFEEDEEPEEDYEEETDLDEEEETDLDEEEETDLDEEEETDLDEETEDEELYESDESEDDEPLADIEGTADDIEFDYPVHPAIIKREDGEHVLALSKYSFVDTNELSNSPHRAEMADLLRIVRGMSSHAINEIFYKMFANVGDIKLSARNLVQDGRRGVRLEVGVLFDPVEMEETFEISDEARSLLSEKMSATPKFASMAEKYLGFDWSENPMQLITDEDMDLHYVLVGCTKTFTRDSKKFVKPVLQDVQTGEAFTLDRMLDLRSFSPIEEFDMCGDEVCDVDNMTRVQIIDYVSRYLELTPKDIKRFNEMDRDELIEEATQLLTKYFEDEEGDEDNFEDESFGSVGNHDALDGEMEEEEDDSEEEEDDSEEEEDDSEEEDDETLDDYDPDFDDM